MFFDANMMWWFAIGAGIGYLIGGVQGAFIGAVVGAAVFYAARWWMYKYGPDTAFVGPTQP
jgi:hypothetical protein